MGFIFLLAGCRKKEELDACKLVNEADAQAIIDRPIKFDQAMTDKVRSLDHSPGVCIYSAGPDETSPRVVVGYRLYDSLDLIKEGFTESKTSVWKTQNQEPLLTIGDDAVLLDGSLIALRKGKVWLQIGVANAGEHDTISKEALKSAAQKATKMF
ncbi:MAG: hypothetical protein ABI999_12740 [Acidobacteriota bacterium]